MIYLCHITEKYPLAGEDGQGTTRRCCIHRKSRRKIDGDRPSDGRQKYYFYQWTTRMVIECVI